MIHKDVVQASSAVSAAPVKGQGQVEQITQNFRVVANGDDDEEEEVAQQARINLIDWDPVSTKFLARQINLSLDVRKDVSISERVRHKPGPNTARAENVGFKNWRLYYLANAVKNNGLVLIRLCGSTDDLCLCFRI